MSDRTAVNQPPHSGDDYPFMTEHALAPLVLDFYLSFQDDACDFVRPFRLQWLFGVGEDVGVQPGDMPTPTHDVDLVILDAADEVVFDSTGATGFGSTDWGSDRRVYEWSTATAVARLVASIDVAGDFEDHEYREDAVLDPRTYNRLPRRVTGLRVGLQRLTGDVKLSAGFNLALAAENVVLTDGSRFVKRVNIDGIPGSGAGRLTGCEDVDPVIRRVNQMLPDAGGNFNIDADDCLRLQGSLFVTDDGINRTAVYSAEGYTAEEARSLQKLHDDCRPCCDCSYFVRTYKGLSRLWDRWSSEAQALEGIRDLYITNRERWLDYYNCRIANPMRLVALTEVSCRTFIGGAYCNTSKCCLRNVELRFTFQLGGTTGLTPSVRDCFISGSPFAQEEAYSPLVTGSVLRCFVDHANPQDSTSVRMRVQVPCSAGQSLRVTITAHAAQPAPNQNGDECILPTAGVPSDILALWGAVGLGSADTRGLLQRDLPLNNADHPSASYC